MRRRETAILTLLVTVLCPLVCLAELAAHRGEHAHGHGAPAATHAHDGAEQPHHQHHPNGEPIPHGEHYCLCTSSATSGTLLQVPPLAPFGLIDGEPAAALGKVAWARGVTHPRAMDPPDFDRYAPLLI